MHINSLVACLAASLLGIASPIFAGDQPDPNFKLPTAMSYGILHNYTPYAPLPPNPEPQASQPSSGGRQLTTAGKVLKWVGVGLMAEGGVNIIIGAATPGERAAWIGSGAVFAGVGAVLFEVGIHKTQ